MKDDNENPTRGTTMDTAEETAVPVMPRRRRKAEEVVCDRCGLYGLCRLAGLESGEAELLDRIVARRQPVAKGQTLYQAGESFKGLFAVKSGAFKAVAEQNGRLKVVDFHLGGELLGLEALDSGRYAHTVEALEAGSVCVMDVDHSDLVGQRLLDFQQELIRTMSERIQHDQWLNALIGTQSAEQRVSAFLLNFSHRLADRGLPSSEFRLPMSREEIADYLGLALETVSRMFRRFQAQGLLVARGRYTRLFDLDGLRQIAGARQG